MSIFGATNWRVAIVWECAIKGRSRPVFDTLINNLVIWINDPQSWGIELSGNADCVNMPKKLVATVASQL